jgi:CPA1 family monovalent cation:H+ antiporter
MEIVDQPPADSLERLCVHAPDAPASPRADACEECGSTFNLRACAQCGHVGCCESQAGDARAHALGESHPVILQMTGDGFGFAWCYIERKYVG